MMVDHYLSKQRNIHRLDAEVWEEMDTVTGNVPSTVTKNVSVYKKTLRLDNKNFHSFIFSKICLEVGSFESYSILLSEWYV